MFTATDEFGLVGDREAHVNRRRGAIGVLHLGLGQRRAAVNAPVHRLVAARDVAGRQDAPERADDVGLEAEIHGEVRFVPVADHAQALEILALALDLYARIVAAGTAEFRCFHLHAGLADFFSTACSIGNPWQSQPGTYGASKPASVRDLTMMSLRILLTAWPRWMSPLAYGGPSCRTYFGRPCPAARSFAYRSSVCQRLRISGSRVARLAFIGKSVCGRFNVFL